MKIILAAIAVLSLSGCAFITGNLPSMQHCDQVVYQRDGNQVSIYAKCRAPIGGALL